MKLGLDFDGTIANWAGAMDRWLQLHERRSLDREHDVRDQVTREQLREMVAAILGTALTFEMEPETDALPVMSRLAEQHELIVLTARHDDEAAFATQWLVRHGAPVREVVFTGRAAKFDACLRLGLEMLLDDTVAHLVPLPDGATLPVLFRSRFGERRPQPPTIRVVDNWLAFEVLCAELAGDERPA